MPDYTPGQLREIRITARFDCPAGHPQYTHRPLHGVGWEKCEKRSCELSWLYVALPLNATGADLATIFGEAQAEQLLRRLFPVHEEAPIEFLWALPVTGGHTRAYAVIAASPRERHHTLDVPLTHILRHLNVIGA